MWIRCLGRLDSLLAGCFLFLFFAFEGNCSDRLEERRKGRGRGREEMKARIQRELVEISREEKRRLPIEVK